MSDPNPYRAKALALTMNWVTKTHAVSPDGSYFNFLVDEIELALKIQDRDTRHACAEAVTCLVPMDDDGMISKHSAHSTIMNVRCSG